MQRRENSSSRTTDASQPEDKRCCNVRWSTGAAKPERLEDQVEKLPQSPRMTTFQTLSKMLTFK
jgi:hypothetical protein